MVKLTFTIHELLPFFS